MKRLAPPSVAQNQTGSHSDSGNTNVNNNTFPVVSQVTETTEAQNSPVNQPNTVSQSVSCQSPNESSELRRLSELMVEIRDTLRSGNRILVGTQNGLARGFNAASYHWSHQGGLSFDLGAHSLINDHGEVPEAYSLPTFKHTGNLQSVSFAIDKLTKDELAQYLRFYGIGEDMIEEGDSLKIKSGMENDARAALSRRLFLNRR